MHAVAICLILLALASSTSLLAQLTRLPLPFLQIGIGIIAALPPFNLIVTLDPQTFLFLFIPPLLFAEGWRLPRRETLALRWPILSHAIGLVLFTVAAGGYALHWLIPEMPLAVACAVAALVSPTDAVAVSAILPGRQLPQKMLHLIESEALLNDASGLVAMRFAVAAALGGGFSIVHAAAQFALVAAGGLAVGALLVMAYAWAYSKFLSRSADATMQTIFLGLLPFAAYGMAEYFDLSGILAAVGAGIAASRVSLLEKADFGTRLQSDISSNVVGYCLNGVIFVLLGLQLPSIIGSGPAGIDLIRDSARNAVLGEIAALTGLLIILRLTWVLAAELLAILQKSPDRLGNWRLILASSLAGVRGAVTLAGALSLPLLMPDGSGFPSRDLAITLATGIVLSSMLIASVALPLLLRNKNFRSPGAQQDLAHARMAAMQAALQKVRATEDAGPREAALAAIYGQHLTSLQDETAEAEEHAWRDLHRTALHAERRQLHQLRRSGEIGDVSARQLLHELDLLEAASAHRPARFSLDGASSARDGSNAGP